MGRRVRVTLTTLGVVLATTVAPGALRAAAEAPGVGAVDEVVIEAPHVGVLQRSLIGDSNRILRGSHVEVVASGVPPVEAHTIEVQVGRGSMLRRTAPALRTVSNEPHSGGSSLGTWRFSVRRGQALCARARIWVGSQAGPWSNRKCVVRPLDDSQLIRRGSMSVRRSTSFDDDKATVLHPYGKLLLRNLPPHAWFGPVFVRKKGDKWSVPSFRLRGQRAGVNLPLTTWVTDGRRTVQTVEAPRGGTAMVEGRAQYTYPVGGLVVLPRWVYRSHA